MLKIRIMKFFIATLLFLTLQTQNTFSLKPSQPSTHQNSHSPSTRQKQTQKTLSENSKNETKSNAVSPTTRQLSSQKNSSPKNPSPSTSERKINQELKQRKQTKSRKKTQKPSRQLNAQNLTEGELEYQRVTTNIVSELEKLPQICQQNSSLKEKTIQFQNKLKMIKEQVLLSQDLNHENLIHFRHPLRNIFDTSKYITFLYEEEDIEFNFEIPEKEEDLREHLIFLSEQLKHKYRYYFKTTDTSIENLPTWNRYIISTLDCFVR